MTVTRRMRFEVLRRDDHACRYCGRRAPEVELTVDHVLPVALGGTDDPSNLATACKDCNSGKAATSPDEHVVVDVAQDALRWAAAMRHLAEQAAEDRGGRMREVAWVAERWEQYAYGAPRRPVPRDPDWVQSVLRWLEAGLSVDDLEHLVDVAMHSPAPPPMTWRYLAGCAWNLLRQRQQQAAELLSTTQGA